LTSANGKQEAAATNNHGTYYDVQVVSFALFIGDSARAREVLAQVPHKRIAVQIEPDGAQPLEIARTKSLGYSTMNLAGLFELALLGDRVGANLWSDSVGHGRSIRKALDYLLPYVSGTRPWPHEQIVDYDVHEFSPLLIIAAVKYQSPFYRDLATKIDPSVERSMDAFLAWASTPQSKTQP
jgi:Alginate lyase